MNKNEFLYSLINKNKYIFANLFLRRNVRFTYCKSMSEFFRLTMDDNNSWVYYRKRLIFLKESICILKNNLIK